MLARTGVTDSVFEGEGEVWLGATPQPRGEKEGNESSEEPCEPPQPSGVPSGRELPQAGWGESAYSAPSIRLAFSAGEGGSTAPLPVGEAAHEDPLGDILDP